MTSPSDHTVISRPLLQRSGLAGKRVGSQTRSCAAKRAKERRGPRRSSVEVDEPLLAMASVATVATGSWERGKLSERAG